MDRAGSSVSPDIPSYTPLPLSILSVIFPACLDIDGEAVGDYSGSSVSLSGDGNRLSLGEVGYGSSNPNLGRVKVFDVSH